MDHPPVKAISRRQFLKASAAGLVVGIALPGMTRFGTAEAATDTPINSWLQVGSDETITLTIGSSDMGQGANSGLAQVLAEELVVDFARVKTVQGSPTLTAPAPIGAAINTVGSGVTRNNFWKLRDAGAIAREMLVQAAMNANGDQTRTNYSVLNGVITYTPNPAITYTYGAVAAAAALLPPLASAPLIPDAQFRLIGKTVPRTDIPAKVDGSAKYGIDIRLPNMVYAAIRHCPTLGGVLASTPTKPTGTLAVVPVKIATGTGRGIEAVGNFNAVAVVATNTWDAWQAAKRLSVSWKLPTNAATLNDAQFLADAQALATTATPFVTGAANPAGTLYTVEGSAAAANTAIAGAARTVAATYTLPYLPHATLEPLNCTVDYVAGTKCDVYAPTQSAKNALSLVMNLTGLPESKVSIKTTFLGGGLGRKAELDFISQAVQVGMAVGKPVKLMWPREEDFTHDQYRPMGLVSAKAGLDAGGNIVGWAYRNVSPSILAQRGVTLGATGDSQGIEGANALPYNLGSKVTEYVTHPAPIPVGFWRSVGASINTFAVESLIDELALAAGQDPYLFRKARLTNPRWVAVLEAAAQLAGWSTAPATGRARGIAIGAAFNSIVATVVEIGNLTLTGTFTVYRVSVAIDCYAVVNPGAVNAQIVGGVVHGMNAALYGKQSFTNGAATRKNYNTNRMIRISEMPQVDVTIIPPPPVLDRAVTIGGVGELGVPTFAPALANAHARLTGTRVRSLPFFPAATMGGI